MQELTERLRTLVREGRVLTGEAERALYAQDVFTRERPAGVVVAPGTVEELREVVRAATTAGHAVVPRGGGMSYTSGYVPAEDAAVLLDLGALNRVTEINREDMYVTVEAGVTWQALDQALADTGLTTPFRGTLSGRHATVGGGLSQNSIFWGSGIHGAAADTVIGLQVVLADGSLLETGAGAQRNAPPFFRHFGPDLTGLFTGDCGALGVKARATLRLVPRQPGRAYAAFAFEDYHDMAPAMSEIARRGLATECFGFDPFLQRQRLKRESLAQDAGQLAGMMKRAGGLGKAVRQGAKVALAGRRFMDEVQWSFNVLAGGPNEAVAQARIDEAVRLVEDRGGRSLPDSIPRMLDAHPFGPVNNMLGPGGERWVPVHGLVPHSRAAGMIERIEALFADHAGAMREHEVSTGYLLATVSTNCFVIEPVFFWPDALFDMHRHYVEDRVLARLPTHPENPDARALVAQLKQAVSDLFSAAGASHLQLARAYHYADALKPEALDLVRALKRQLDPDRRMNPGALGL